MFVSESWFELSHIDDGIIFEFGFELLVIVEEGEGIWKWKLGHQRGYGDMRHGHGGHLTR